MRVFYFDVGGVLIPDNFGPADAFKAFQQLAERQSFDPAAAYGQYAEMQPSFDLGQISLPEFCTRIGASQKEFEQNWLAMHPVDGEVLHVIDRLLAQGHCVGLATNFCRELLDLLIHTQPVLSRLAVCCSSDIGLVKPSQDFFRYASRLVPARETVFVDDREVNIQGAREFGWTAVHATSGWLRGFEQRYLA